MNNHKFQLDNFLKYYKAEIDRSWLRDQLYSENEGELKSCEIEGDMLKTVTDAFVADVELMVPAIDEESGEEIEVELYVYTDYKYTTWYRILVERLDVDKCEETLQTAIDKGESKFVVDVDVSVYEIANIEADVSGCSATPEISKNEIYNIIDACISHDSKILMYDPGIQETFRQPSDKIVRFICTIPSN